MHDLPVQIVPRRSKREWARFPVSLLAECSGRPFEGGACTIEVSKCGIRIQTDVPLSLHQLLFLFQRCGEMPLLCCRVAWVREPHRKRPSEVGLEFLD